MDLLSYQPFESHHLVRSHKLQGMMKVTQLMLFTKACVEHIYISMHKALRRSSLTHICTLTCPIYTINYRDVCDTLVYTYSLLT